MTGNDYNSAIRGGLKLKGSTQAGVKKKKKKKTSKPSILSSATASSALQVAAFSKETRTKEEKEADKEVLLEKKKELEMKLSIMEEGQIDPKSKGTLRRDPEPEVDVEMKRLRAQLEKLEDLILAASDPTVAKFVIEAATEETERGYKTPAQIRQEEMKRKRLEEKFEKEGGVKTHKERVEELNRYLSGLSEHHDMPKIGPG